MSAEEESEYSFSGEDFDDEEEEEERYMSRSKRHEISTDVQDLDGATDGEDQGEEDEDEDEDEDDYDIASFLNRVDDIPTALAALKGSSRNVVENMKMVDTPDLLEDDEEKQTVVDEWSDVLSERLGMAPQNRRAHKRRQQSRLKKQKKGQIVRDRSGMPEAAKAMLGNGNLKYAVGDYDEAEKLYMQCLRLAPEFPDAYSSLSRLYEERGDLMKSMNFLIVAAHLSKKESQIWKDAAIKSKEQGALRQAVYCFNQVIRREKDDAVWRLERGRVLIDLNMEKKALEDLLYYYEKYPGDPEIIKTITRVMYHMDCLEDAQNAISKYISDYPETTDLTHINLLAELYVHRDIQNWQGVLDLMEHVRQGGVDLPPELASKEAVALANLNEIEKAMEISNDLIDMPVDVFPDVFLFLATEFDSLDMHSAAVPYLEKLACEVSQSSMDVWQQYANSMMQLKRSVDGSIEAWKKIVNQVPHSNPDFADAVIELCSKLYEIGNLDDASKYLDVLNDVDPFPPGVLTIPEASYLKRAEIFKACNRNNLYIKFFLEPVIKSLSMILSSSDAASKKSKGKRRALNIDDLSNDLIVWESSQEKRRKGNRGKPEGEDENKENRTDQKDDALVNVPVLSNPIKERKNFEMVQHLIEILMDEGMVKQAYTVADLAVAVLAKKQPNKERRDTIRVYLADCCCKLGDLSTALKHIKSPAEMWPEKAEVWNVFSKIALGVGGVRQTSKYISSMRKKFPLSLPLALLSGHVFLQSHRYGSALGEYLDAYRLDPSEASVKLCISNLFANYACASKKNRDVALMHALAWMQEYGRGNRNPVEVAYNAGRIAHQFSLAHLAVPLYHEALHHRDIMLATDSFESLNFKDEELAKFAPQANLRPGMIPEAHLPSQEAAFNLSLILKESGAHTLAKELVVKYLMY